MKLVNKQVLVQGRRVSLLAGCGSEMGRAYLYLLGNDLHNEPFGFVEDVYVERPYRGNDYGKKLMDEVIRLARELGCYKLILTSRHDADRARLHQWYKDMGFIAHGEEFRLDLAEPTDKVT